MMQPSKVKKDWRAQIMPLLLAAVLLLAGAACDKLPLPNQPPVDVGLELFGEGKPRLALITGAEGAAGAYYAPVWGSFERVRDNTGAGIAYVKAAAIKDYSARLLELQKKGAEVIVTVGQNSVADVRVAAAANPDIRYIVIDAGWRDTIPDNVLAVNFKGEEVAYLAGYFAAVVSSTNVLGYISCRDDEVTGRYYTGFKAGSALIRSNMEIMKGLAGDTPTSAHIAAMAKQMAVNRTDVIFHIVGPAAAGIVDAASGVSLRTFGMEVDQAGLSSDVVMFSFVKRYDEVTEKALTLAGSENFSGGRTQFYGLADGAWDITAPDPDNDKYTAPFEKLLEFRDEIIAGDREVPYQEY